MIFVCDFFVTSRKVDERKSVICPSEGHFTPENPEHIPGGALHILWVRGRAIGKGIDFPDIGIKNGINFTILV